MSRRVKGAALLRLLGAVAILGGCFDADDVSPTAPPSVEALTLTASASQVPADGFSTVDLLARVDPRADADKRTVSFTASEGMLLGNLQNGALKVVADGQGRAEAQLRSSLEVTTATVEATIDSVDGVVRRLEIAFVAADLSTIVSVSATPSTLEADGDSRAVVVAEIAPALTQRQVSFSTTRGAFADSGNGMTMATAGASNQATVELEAIELGTARITATVGGSTASTTVELVRALPDTILVDPGQSQLRADPSDVTTITATLLRTTRLGMVTPGTVVEFRLLGGGSPLTDAVFETVTPSDAMGTATARLSVPGVSFRGTAVVEARVGSVVGRANLQIVDP